MQTSHSIRVFALICLSAFSFGARAGSPEKTFVISGTRFTYPLIEKWIAAYTSIHPQIKIVLAARATTQTPDLNIIAHEPFPNELHDGQEIVYTGTYALLPVTNRFNPNLAAFSRKGLSGKEVDKLFFEVVDYDSDEPVQQPHYPATIYARDNKACTSTALAAYFGHNASEIRGKKVFGDDVFLLSAIRNDSIALTFNPLNYLYDSQTRQLKDGLRILPVDLKKDARILLSGTLDQVIDVLERYKIETIPVEKIGFVYNPQTAGGEVNDFLKWVLTEGQQYNHALGFLNSNKTLLSQQLNRLNGRLLTLK